ncbi:MAG TPA: hypothetical protein VJK52_00540 [Candidatus Nanoarchaeia archaeon]|nr:hypothetical protein [Candidatus Nanoarchaeia archaeon]
MRKRLILLSLALVPSAFALQGPTVHDMRDMLASIGKALHGILQDQYGQYFVTVILAWILFYTVYASVASRVHLFRGSG